MSQGSSSSSSASTTHSRSRPRNLVIGATNRPFDVDAALLRRLTVLYHVPLPNFAQRVCILQNMLTMSTTTNGSSSSSSSSSSSHNYFPIHLWDKTRLPQSEQQQEVNFDQVAMATKGYSPSDLRHLLQTAVVNVMREAKETEGDDDHHHHHRPLTTLDIFHAMQSVPATRLSPHYRAAMTQFTSSRRGKNSNMMNSQPEENEDYDDDLSGSSSSSSSSSSSDYYNPLQQRRRNLDSSSKWETEFGNFYSLGSLEVDPRTFDVLTQLAREYNNDESSSNNRDSDDDDDEDDKEDEKDHDGDDNVHNGNNTLDEWWSQERDRYTNDDAFEDLD